MRKAGGVDGGEPLDVSAAAGQGFVVRAWGEVGELVVVALVAEDCGILRLVAKLVLPYLVEEAGEIAAAGGDVLGEVPGGNGGGSGRGRGAQLGVEWERQMRRAIGRCRDSSFDFEPSGGKAPAPSVSRLGKRFC